MLFSLAKNIFLTGKKINIINLSSACQKQSSSTCHVTVISEMTVPDKLWQISQSHTYTYHCVKFFVLYIKYSKTLH